MENNKGKILKIRTDITYQAFCDFYAEHGVYPTMEEVAIKIEAQTGYCSPNSVRKYLMALAEEGRIEYIPGRVHPFRLEATAQRQINATQKK